MKPAVKRHLAEIETAQRAARARANEAIRQRYLAVIENEMARAFERLSQSDWPRGARWPGTLYDALLAAGLVVTK